MTGNVGKIVNRSFKIAWSLSGKLDLDRANFSSIKLVYQRRKNFSFDTHCRSLYIRRLILKSLI